LRIANCDPGDDYIRFSKRRQILKEAALGSFECRAVGFLPAKR
jgi:hypothetical protein